MNFNLNLFLVQFELELLFRERSHRLNFTVFRILFTIWGQSLFLILLGFEEGFTTKLFQIGVNLLRGKIYEGLRFDHDNRGFQLHWFSAKYGRGKTFWKSK